MRNLHPGLSMADQETPLDPSVKQWRHAAAAAMGLPKEEYGRFGGLFKEAIKVSSFSRRCYAEARTIMQEMQATRQKVNASIFGSCCGYNDEASLYPLLHRMAQGHFSREEFKEKVAQEKGNYKGQDDGTNIWKRKAEKLKEENIRLKKEVEELHKQLATKQGMAKQTSTSSKQVSQQVEREDLPEARARPESVLEETVASCSQENPTDNPYEFSGSDISPPPQRKKPRRSAVYRVSYKPRSESSEELDDSVENQEWTRRKSDKSSSDLESDESNLNEGFVESPNRPMSPRALFSSDMLESPAKSPTRSQPGTTVSTTTDFRITLPKLDENADLEDLTPAANTTATRRTRDRPNTSRIFKVGEIVQGLFINQGREKWQEWCRCEITAVILNGHMYRVLFNDGVTQTLKKIHVKGLDE